MGLPIPIVSRSQSLSLENFLPSSPFLLQWFTILSDTPICLKNVLKSSTEKPDIFPSDGIVISVSGMNFGAVNVKTLMMITDQYEFYYNYTGKTDLQPPAP